MNKLFALLLCVSIATAVRPINLCIMNNDDAYARCGILDSIVRCDDHDSRIAPGSQISIAVKNEQQFTIFRPFTNVCASGAYYPFRVTVRVDSSLPGTSQDCTCLIRDITSHAQEKSYTIKLDEQTSLLIERGEPVRLN